jgi:hypothetical protein
MTDPTPIKVPSSKSTGLRGRKLVFPSPIAVDKVKSRRPLTKETAKQEIPVKDDGVGFSFKRRGKSISDEIVDYSPLLKKREIPLLRGSKGSSSKQELRLIA